jgi:hypothetical protein
MNRTKRAPIIAISVILISALLVLSAFAGLYLYSEAVIFDHRDSSEVHSTISPAEGFSVKYPFFANPMALSGSGGRSYTLTLLNGGEKNIEVYEAVNAPVYIWVDYLYNRYRGRVNLDYSLEQDGKTITVSMSGNVYEGENSIPVEQKFVFDIENADSDQLPKWINEEETDEEYREFFGFVTNPTVNPMPDWYGEM